MSNMMTEETIFATAIEIQRGKQRESYLDDVCRDNTPMRDRVEQLIAAHESAHQLVDQPIDLDQTRFADEQKHSPGPGSRIGRYKLLQEIELAINRQRAPYQQDWLKFELAIVLQMRGESDRATDYFREVYRTIANNLDHENSFFWDSLTDWSVLVQSAILSGEEVDHDELIERARPHIDLVAGRADVAHLGQISLGMALVKSGETDNGLEKLKAGILGTDFSWPAINPVFYETRYLKWIEEHGRIEDGVQSVQEFVQHRDASLFSEHPEIGLVRIRTAEFLVQHNRELDLSQEYLEQTKAHLQGRPMLPAKHIQTIDELLRTIETKKLADSTYG